MRKKLVSCPQSRFWLPALAGLFLYLLGPASGAQRLDDQEERTVDARSILRHIIPGTGELQLIVELEEAPVIQSMQGNALMPSGGRGRMALDRRRMDLRSARALETRDRLRASQAALTSRLGSLRGARVQASIDTVLNAVIVRVPADQFLGVRDLPGVRKVHFSRPQKLLLDAAATVHKASVLWSHTGGPVNAGRGVKIGIIDSGIDIDNPMVIDSSLSAPAGYPKGEQAYTNGKVIVARNYMHLLSYSQAVRTAIDEVGHGTFVAGCAAGKTVGAPLATISGMAPGAYLGSYKVFGTPGINDTTTNAAVIAAIDAAVNDGMDVMNLSLGSLDYLPAADDPMVQAIENAVAAGVVAVVSAGNEGPETHTLGNPGTAPGAITVGAASNGRIFATLLRATAPAPVPESLQNVPYTLGTGPAVTARIPPTEIVDVSALDGDGLACAAFPARSLSGKLAFIQRGTCYFSEKVANAANAGAVAAIVYNNVPGAEAIMMGGLASAAIPAVMISNPDGLNLADFIAANPAQGRVEVENSLNPIPLASTPGVMAGFSSRGPGSDFELKPDLIAVGTAVYSAAQNNNANGGLYSSTQFASAQGTSFSSPIVAGAAAALLAINPALTPQKIKSLLVNTASREAAVDAGATAGTLAAGAGLLDMGRAAAAGTAFTPSSLSFGVTSYLDSVSLTETLTIQNISSSADRYELQIEPTIAGPSVRLSSSATGTIAPGGTATVDLTVSAAAPVTGGFQGFVTAKSERTSETYRIPYWAGIYVPDRTRVLTVTQAGGGSGAYSSLSDAVRAAQPGNIIEIADDGSYSGGMVLSANAQGLPLHGLTIRAASGRSPTITAPSAASANIGIVGLRDVLLQGLHIDGGQSGIELVQPADSLPLSATIDRCVITNTASAGAAAAGIAAWDGSTVSVTRTTISGSTGLGVLVSGGVHLAMVDSTVDSSGDDGIDAFDSNVQLLRTAVFNANGSGAYLEACSGTIEGSTFSRCRGRLGDGIEIFDGDLTVSRCNLESNEQVGVYLSATRSGSGAAARLLHNQVRGNAYGFYFNPGRAVEVQANFLENNGCGMRVTSSTVATIANNIVVSSTDPTAGDGIQLAGFAEAKLVNNTIFGNAGRGVSFSGFGLVSVVNCIVAGHTRGDLGGLPSGSVSYSLIGDGSQTAGNNIAGSPKFTDSGGDDYSLVPGSPGVDAGSNAAASIPFLDYNRMVRVASTGSSPGEGRVDMGALESDSSYPLLFPLLANGNQSTLRDTFTTGLAILNKEDRSVRATLIAYDQAGGLLAGSRNPESRTFAGKTQVPILGWQLFGFDTAASRLGSALVSATDRLTGLFLVFDQDFGRIADGVDVSDAAATDLVLMRHMAVAPDGTTYVIFNPGVNPANVTATLYAPEGAVSGVPKSITILPKGQAVADFSSASSASGYVRIRSDRPVSALEFFGSTDKLAALRAVSPGTDARLYFPHFAVNGGFSTKIGIVNGGPQPADVILSAMSSEGRLISDPVSKRLAAGAQMLESVADLFGLPSGPLTTGYIVAKGSHGGLTGFTSFVFEDASASSAAAVPADSVPAQSLAFSHVAHQVPAGAGRTYQTGIALLNPFGSDVSYAMRVFDGDGRLLAEKSDVLAPGEKTARLLSHPAPGAGFFTQSLVMAGGHVEVTSDLGLLGFELFFTEDLSQLASVPAQNP